MPEAHISLSLSLTLSTKAYLKLINQNFIYVTINIWTIHKSSTTFIRVREERKKEGSKKKKY